MEQKIYTLELAGKTLTAEFSPIAEQANGSVLVRFGETVVFATAVMAKEPRGDGAFFPLTVDYEEKFYAAGRILGSRFMRREGRPSEEAILVSRVIDRSIRPLFDQRMRNEVHVVVMTLAVDEENDPDVPAVIAASLALGTSDIPWNGPLGSIRVIQKDGACIVNPSYAERAGAVLDTFFCGMNGHISMIETEAHEVAEEDVLAAFEKGIEDITAVVEFQKRIIAEIGKQKRVLEFPEPTKELETALKPFREKLETALYEHDKMLHAEGVATLKHDWMAHVAELFPDTPRALAEDMFEGATNDIIHKNILDVAPGNEQRPDGRALDEIRPLFAKAHITARNHGSALFFRGQTHILSVATLGAPGDVLLIEGMEVREKRNFMHHYNFPPFSVGETKPMRGPGRREIGHGALAEKALRAVVPQKESFPYTIRVVSETLSSNGSSSMGSVCASTMALMDAGVPISAMVAGISMGLIMDEHIAGGTPRYKVLTDIQGVEDHLGDMDFKVAGTRAGVTAIQMDVKIDGVPLQILHDAFAQAKCARVQILDVMEREIGEPRKELSPYAPRIITLHIHPDKIREVIGPGGKVINEIIAKSGAQIDIEQDGTVFITGATVLAAEMAQELVEEITREYEVGQRFEGVVTRIFNFGAMIEIGPHQEGLVHISELAPFRVEHVTDIVDTGDKVPVEIVGIDEMGRVNLSIKKVATLEPKKQGTPRSDTPHDNNHRGNRNEHSHNTHHS